MVEKLCSVPRCKFPQRNPDGTSKCAAIDLADNCAKLYTTNQLPPTFDTYNLGACQMQCEAQAHIEKLTRPPQEKVFIKSQHPAQGQDADTIV